MSYIATRAHSSPVVRSPPSLSSRTAALEEALLSASVSAKDAFASVARERARAIRAQEESARAQSLRDAAESSTRRLQSRLAVTDGEKKRAVEELVAARLELDASRAQVRELTALLRNENKLNDARASERDAALAESERYAALMAAAKNVALAASNVAHEALTERDALAMRCARLGTLLRRAHEDARARGIILQWEEE